MARRTLELDLNRVEGDLTFQVEIEDERVADARCIGTTYRGFEQIMVGRSPRDALVIPAAALALFRKWPAPPDCIPWALARLICLRLAPSPCPNRWLVEATGSLPEYAWVTTLQAFSIGLSPPVERAVPVAAATVARLLQNRAPHDRC